MMKAGGQSILGAAAIAACALGLVMTLQSARAMPDAAAQLKRRASDYGKLVALAARQEDIAAAKSVFEELDRKRAVPMADLVQSGLPGVRVEVRPRDATPLAGGWSLRSVDVTLDDVDIAVASRLLAAAAVARPPWRPVEIAVTALDRPGAGRVSLMMEAIEKAGN
ncbi:MAG: hypothetical protein V1929_08700 [bacterium]